MAKTLIIIKSLVNTLPLAVLLKVLGFPFLAPTFSSFFVPDFVSVFAPPLLSKFA